jgi:hypothetical protein
MAERHPWPCGHQESRDPAIARRVPRWALGQADRPALRLCPPGGEAVVAVDRFAVRRSEGNLGLAATAGAGGREHLTWATAGAVARATIRRPTARTRAIAAGAVARATAVTARGLAAGTARRTATGVAELALSVELLLARGEGELLPAVGAGKHLICIQRRNSSRDGFRDLDLAKVRERSDRVRRATLMPARAGVGRVTLPHSLRHWEAPCQRLRPGSAHASSRQRPILRQAVGWTTSCPSDQSVTTVRTTIRTASGIWRLTSRRRSPPGPACVTAAAWPTQAPVA